MNMINEVSHFSPNIISVERAIHDLRSGLPVCIYDDAHAILIQSAETLTEPNFVHAASLAEGTIGIIVPAVFAAHLGVSIPPTTTGRLSLGTLSDVVEIQKQITDWMEKKSSASVLQSDSDTLDDAAIRLVKSAALLPFALLWKVRLRDEIHSFSGQYGVLSVDREAILAHGEHIQTVFTKISEAQLPLKESQDARVAVFRSPFTRVEHLAIMVGDLQSIQEPLVRIHSSCVTGDILGSLRCDCGEQLHQAIHAINHNGGGVLLYLNQEGRGIGIANKIRAYALQDQGNDTVDANTMLGFEPDERNFTVAAELLKQLGITHLKLLTNNPRKLETLTKNGITVTKREPLILPSNAHNHGYLSTKARRLGHLL